MEKTEVRYNLFCEVHIGQKFSFYNHEYCRSLVRVNKFMDDNFFNAIDADGDYWYIDCDTRVVVFD